MDEGWLATVKAVGGSRLVNWRCSRFERTQTGYLLQNARELTGPDSANGNEYAQVFIPFSNILVIGVRRA